VCGKILLNTGMKLHEDITQMLTGSDELWKLMFKEKHEASWEPLINFSIDEQFKSQVLDLMQEVCGPDYELKWEVD